MVIKVFIIVIACMIIAYHCGYVNAINDIEEDENNETDV